MLYLDLETRSQCDLTFHGLRRYSEDPSTQVICMAYCFDDEPMQFWWHYEPFPQEIKDYEGPITAHNAEFERHLFEFVIYEDYGYAPELKQWRCSMALSLANGYPASLDAAAKGLGLPFSKMGVGKRLIKEYCAPNFKEVFDTGDDVLMQEYCEADVSTMRQMTQCLRDLTEDEWAEYHLNCRINDRGIPVDVSFCTNALSYANACAADSDNTLSRLTSGVMTKHTQRKARDAWILPKLTEKHIELITVHKKGVAKLSFDQEHRRYLLERGDLRAEVREVINAIDEAGSSALKKYGAAANTHVDGRVHNTFLWHGAQTGRFSGRGLQPHNMRRDVYGDTEAETLIADVVGNYKIEEPATTMARLLRPMVKSTSGLYWSDWSSIEGRAAPWLADMPSGEKKLDLYREGKDVYVVTAAQMFNKKESDVDKDLRQSGKIAELSLQFGGSRNALQGMAKNYGIVFENDEAQDIVDNWRDVNPWATSIWTKFDDAIRKAVRNFGTTHAAGRCVYYADENFLWCELPSGKLLAYPKPRIEYYLTPWDEERRGATFQVATRPPFGEEPLRRHARGALLFQNAVQATASNILREALIKADAAGLKIVSHVHDEIIGEGPPSDGDKLNAIMLEQPAWAEGLPLDTGGVMSGRRWGK